MTTLRLTKHHGFGNDFLVAFDGAPEHMSDWASVARAVCHRRTGIGADGLLVASAGPGSIGARTDVAVVMTLYNADGSVAEMSGNGVRCLVQALVMEHRLEPGDVRVATDAGARVVTWHPSDDGATIIAAVDMGAVVTIAEPDGWAVIGAHHDRPVAHLSVGNPHTVVGVDEVESVDLERLGRQVDSVNLEIIEAGPEPNAVTMRVHERGVGITEACGTGAVASAWAARLWGFVPATGDVVVHMAGGSAVLLLDRPEVGHVTLTGPATYIGRVEVELPTGSAHGARSDHTTPDE